MNTETYARTLAKKAREISNEKQRLHYLAKEICSSIYKKLEVFECEWNENFDSVTVSIDKVTLYQCDIDSLDGYSYLGTEIYDIMREDMKVVGFGIKPRPHVYENETGFSMTFCLTIL